MNLNRNLRSYRKTSPLTRKAHSSCASATTSSIEIQGRARNKARDLPEQLGHLLLQEQQYAEAQEPLAEQAEECLHVLEMEKGSLCVTSSW